MIFYFLDGLHIVFTIVALFLTICGVWFYIEIIVWFLVNILFYYIYGIEIILPNTIIFKSFTAIFVHIKEVIQKEVCLIQRKLFSLNGIHRKRN